MSLGEEPRRVDAGREMLTRTTIPEPLRQLHDAAPLLGIPYDDEHPRLRVRGVDGGVEDPCNVVVGHRWARSGGTPSGAPPREEKRSLAQAPAG